MSRLSDNDKNWGPFTLGTWFKQFSLRFETGEESGKNRILITGFRHALRISLPCWAKTCGLDYGIALNAEGNGYDYLAVTYGLNSDWDSSKNKRWSWFLPWKQWKHVRTSIYNPDGSHFFTEKPREWKEYFERKEECPKSYFKFKDHDGTEIIASCIIEEREWHRGEKWCSWMRFFWPKMIRRSMWMELSAEMGPEKGSWKGGTTGCGIDMESGETPESAFVRWCGKDQRSKHRSFKVNYLGLCGPPPPKPKVKEDTSNTGSVQKA